MAPKYLIYGLIDLRSGELRYVGQTDHLPCQRLAQHEHAARHKKDRRHITQWILSLQAEGMRPEMFVLEGGISTKVGADETEIFYIGYFKMAGCRLTNHTIGGDGCVGYKHGPEARAHISAGKKGKVWSEDRKLERRFVLPEKEIELVEAYKAGASLEQVGLMVGLTHAWAGKMLKRCGVSRRSPNAPSINRVTGHRKLDNATELKIAERYLSGLSTKASGEGLGLTDRAVARTLHRRGIEVRSSGAGRWLTECRKKAA